MTGKLFCMLAATGLIGAPLQAVRAGDAKAAPRGPSSSINEDSIPSFTSRTFTLENAGAESVARVLSQLLETKGYTTCSVSSGPAIDSLIVSAPQEEFEMIAQVVERLDSAVQHADLRDGEFLQIDQGCVVRVVSLAHVDCADVASRIKLLFAEQSEQVRITWFQPGNVVLLRAPVGELEQIASVISQIDKPTRAENFSGVPPVEVLSLKYAEARQVVRIVEAIVTPLGHPEKSFKIRFDQRLNTVIMSGDTESLERARDILVKLDIPAPARAETH